MSDANIECPVDLITVNENKVRITALLVLAITITFLFTHSWIVPAFLTADFFARAFRFPKFSLLNISSEFIVNIFKIVYKPTDQGPKRFAAKVGFVCALFMVAFTVFNLNTLAFAVAIMIAVFAFLESFLGFCAGCYMYTFLKKI